MKENLKVEELFDMLSELDEEVLQEALAADDKKDLDAVKSREPIKTLFLDPTYRKLLVACVCIVVIIVSVFTIDRIKLLSNGNSIDSSHSDVSDSQDTVKNESQPVGSGDKTTDTSEPQTSKPQTSESQTSEPNGFSGENTDSKPQNQGGENDSNGNSGENGTSEDFSIDSIDMLNFYSAKKAISNTFLPFWDNVSFESVKLSKGNITYTEVDRYTEFTVSMVTYFTVDLTDENGFLAQKLGGKGTVEVVVTENNLENMITFKRGDTYYSCLWNGATYKQDDKGSLESATFSTHKYIEGFNIVKNLEQENYEFTVYFDGSKVTGIDCECYGAVNNEPLAVPDSISVTDDYCVVMYVEQTFTIEQLEVYFGNGKAEGVKL